MRKSFSRKFFDMVRGNFISRVFGFLREVVVAFYFGASRATDLFAIAFTIPTLFRRILGEDMVEKAFLPSFRQLIAAGEYRRAWILASRIFNFMMLLLLLLSFLKSLKVLLAVRSSFLRQYALSDDFHDQPIRTVRSG